MVLLVQRISTLILATASCFCANSFAAVSKPNIVFILADDLGWSDTTLYGTTSLYQTPNLERLAKSGMTFTHAYSASPLCSPTRSSILTGLNPARTGLTAPNCHTAKVLLKAGVVASAAPHVKTLVCDSVTRFDTKYYTLAERLKDEGYATGHFGKWHLGPEPYSPLEHGFDVDIPHWHGPGPAGSFVAPWKYPNFKEKVPKEHIEDRMADEAVAWMEKNADQPFFLNYWQFSVHAPFDAKAELIEKYKKLIDPTDPQRSPTYAAMVHSMDDAVGSLLDALERLKLTDNTIVIFFSDNGGNMYNSVDDTTPTSNTPLRGGKATMWEGGVRVPCVVRWPGRVQPATTSDAMVQSTDFYPTILEMLKLTSESTFDGISFVPALDGKVLDRQAIYTYFPHKPGVPDHLPPAVSVHQGDWKMIRLFFEGEEGAHKNLLYHLKEDIGEGNDLSKAYPERVAAMDALIEAFLKDTEAVRPQPNPRYKNTNEAGNTVLGWKPAKHCSLSAQNKALIITSTGNDPHLSHLLNQPVPAGKIKMEVTLSSSVGGNAQLFWGHQKDRPLFTGERSISFGTKPSTEQRTYITHFEAGKPIHNIRFDPARKPGTIHLTAMRLIGENGRVFTDWSSPE